MSIYARFKKSPDGLRQLVELFESTPKSRRQKMIDTGSDEDPEYTDRALQFMFTFKDILGMPDQEILEVLAETPPQLIAYAVHSESSEVKAKFLRLSPPRLSSEVQEALDGAVTPDQVSGARGRMVTTARKLEKAGIIKTKQIPTS